MCVVKGCDKHPGKECMLTRLISNKICDFYVDETWVTLIWWEQLPSI